MTKSYLNDIKKSQDFLSSKFDDLFNSVKELRAENDHLRSKNAQLRDWAAVLDDMPISAEKNIENLKQYLRHDLLQIHGVPATREENTNDIVKQVVHLIDPKVLLHDTADISISHRLSANEGYIPPIIVKSNRRDILEIKYIKRIVISFWSVCQIWVSNKILVSISMRALP